MLQERPVSSTGAVRARQLPKDRYRTVVARGQLLDKVFFLRYKSYAAENYIQKSKSRRFMDEYDKKKSNTSFLTFYGDRAIGSIRACVYYPAHPTPLPIMVPFGEEIGSSIGYDQPMVEANRFVVDPDFQHLGGARARFNLFRNIIATALSVDAACILAAVRVEHVKFYRMLYFRPVGDFQPKPYPDLNFSVVLLACSDISSFQRLVWRKTC
jgi:N-acyl-L-homoserine lactone synthetase